MILMWSCLSNMPKYYPGLRDILPDQTRILPGQDHIITVVYIITILILFFPVSYTKHEGNNTSHNVQSYGNLQKNDVMET